MDNLRGCHRSLAGWFARLNNVLVRVLPYSTQYWKGARAQVYSGSVGYPGPPQVDPTINEVLQTELDRAFAAHNPASGGQPDFIVVQPVRPRRPTWQTSASRRSTTGSARPSCSTPAAT
jgi:hypothetical protein